MRAISAVSALTLAAASLLVGCSAPAASPSAAPGTVTCVYRSTGTPSRPVNLPPTTNIPATGTVDYVMKLNIGDVGLILDRAGAPCAVNSFESLAKQGFYDNTTCHRMGATAPYEFLQCGDPTGLGTGTAGYEFDNESTGSETYPAGTLAMANRGQPGTQDSQFFMTFGDAAFAPDYTVFGQFDAAGMALLKKAAAAGTDSKDGSGVGHPVTKVTIISVTPR